MTGSDLGRGFQKVYNGETDPSFRNGLLIVLGTVILIAVLIHLRMRMKIRKTPDSENKLFRELARVVHIPLLTRLLLKWVARSAKIHATVLLVSEKAFESCVTRWESQPTFTPLRHWGRKRLDTLRGALFPS